MKSLFKKTIALVLCALTCLSLTPSVFATPSYWGFDEYETYQNPNCEEITSYPTVFTKVSDSKYSMVSQTEGGTVTITFAEMAWGTYNLWEWYVTNSNGTKHNIVSGGTDLEYVQRTITSGGKLTFTGGNHGNEALISLDFYNGDTGEKITLAKNQSVTVNKLHIIEKTKLLLHPDANGDSIGDYNNKSMSYTDNDVFANVTRKYTVTGPQVKLNVDYEYVKDTKHGLSYTCMFPVAKKYGLYADMIDKDGKLIKTVETLEVGAADYSGTQHSGNAATRVIIYGKTDSRYQFDIHINTLKDSLDNLKNSFKTSFWDMNETQNKLYFSHFDSVNLTEIKAGEELHTECVWRFNYDADGRTPNGSSNSDGCIDNLARGKEYQISVTNDNPGDGTNTSYNANLTDGKAANTLNTKNDTWFTFNAYKPNTINGIGTITVPLGDSYKITKLRLHLANYTEWYVNPPKSISAYALIDGEYKKIGTFETDSGATAIYWTECEVSDVVTDTIRFDFELNGGFAYVNEVEVHGETPKAPAIEGTNLALDKSYTTSQLFRAQKVSPWGWDENEEIAYPDEDGISLTDGKKPADDASYNAVEFAGFHAKCPDYIENGYSFITVDLEKTYFLKGFAVNCGTKYNSVSGISVPSKIEIFVSDDGETWGDAVATVSPTDDESVASKDIEILLDTAVSGRYIQYRLTSGGNWIMVSEVEAYEGEAPNEPDKPETKSYALGDINMDETVNQYDYILAKRAHFNTVTLTEAQKTIGDVWTDGKNDQYDYILIKRIHFKNYSTDKTVEITIE